MSFGGDEYTTKLNLDTGRSVDNVARLKAEIEKLKAAHAELNQNFRIGVEVEEDYIRISDQFRAEIVQKTDVLNRMSGSLGIGGQGLGQAMLQSSYAVQDFTSQLGTRGLSGALAAVQNNIPSILMGLGVSGGIAGAVSLLAVGLAAAEPLWSKLFGAEAAEQLKKTSAEMTKMAEQAKALTEGPTKAEKTRAQKVTEFLTGGGATGALAAAIEASPYGEKATYGETAKLEAFRLMGGAAGGGLAAEAIGAAMSPESVQQAVRARNLQRAAGLIGQATAGGAAGERALTEMQMFAGLNPGALPPGFALGLAGLTKAGQAEMAAEIAGEQEAGRRSAAGGAAQKEMEKNRKFQDAALGRREAEDLREDRENETAVARAAREQEAGERKNKAEMARLKREAEQYARQHTAVAEQRRRAEEMREQVTGAVQQNVWGTPDYMSDVTQQALANARGGQVMGDAIWNAVQQTDAKNLWETARRVQQMSQSRLGP